MEPSTRSVDSRESNKGCRMATYTLTSSSYHTSWMGHGCYENKRVS